jgi:hypothetical protein
MDATVDQWRYTEVAKRLAKQAPSSPLAIGLSAQGCIEVQRCNLGSQGDRNRQESPRHGGAPSVAALAWKGHVLVP